MTPKPTYEDLELKVKVLEAELRKFKQQTDDAGHDVAERKRLERDLSHMHDLMHYVIWQANAAIAIHDRDMKYIYVSENYLKQYKVKEKDVIGKHHYDVFPDLPQKWRDVHQRVLAGAVEGNDEDIYVRADGSVDWTRWTCRPWYESDGSIGGIIVDTEVITDRKRAEEALRKSEENYRQLFENAPTAIYKIDFTTGKFLKANDVVCEFLGCSQGDITSLSPYDIMTDESKQLLSERLRIIASGGAVVEDPEYEIIDKKGKRRWLQLHSKNIYDKTGSVIGADVVASEITDLKRAEEELRASEEKYRLLAENAMDVIWTFSLETMRFTYISPSVLQMRGYTVEEAMELTIEQSLSPESYEQIIKTINEELVRDNREGVNPRRSKTLVVQQPCKDGTYRWAEVTASFIRNAEGLPIQILGVTRDITDRKHAEEEKRSLTERLQRAEKMEALGQLAGGVAHDLNNVLGVSTIYSELLQEKIPEGSPLRRYVDSIFSSTRKCAAIIEDLLTLARRSVITSNVISLNDIVAGFLTTPAFEKMKEYHPRVTFRTECDDNLLNVKGSPVHLEKTLMNLVSNAAESISGEGVVTIRTESRYLDKPVMGYDAVKEGDYAVLTVSDTGMGIPAESRKKIFEPFYTKKAMGRSGTGLGLAIVWGTVKDHHGYIDLQTEVEKGSTFTLYFPVTREDLITQQQKMPVEEYMGTGESVLVVDDVAEQRDVAARLLDRLGYKVHAVSSGEEALEYLKGNKADILVLDMVMAPGIDGLETYRRVLAISPKQKAIIVSGFSETERVKQAQEMGAGVYVKKPYIMEKIGIAIREELNR
ncbi:MAG: PAS domain S-box protein [Syntrophales bacterium]